MVIIFQDLFAESSFMDNTNIDADELLHSPDKEEVLTIEKDKESGTGQLPVSQADCWKDSLTVCSSLISHSLNH